MATPSAGSVAGLFPWRRNPLLKEIFRENPGDAPYITRNKGQSGRVISNGTAVLGLGNLGAGV